MNIVLSQKDADFILKFIRADADMIDERYKELNKAENDLRETYKNGNFNNLDKIKNIMEVSGDLATTVRGHLTELKNDITRCIELLTIGSEAAE